MEASLQWQCPVCRGGFIGDMWERMSKGARQLARNRHRAAHHAEMTSLQWIKATRRLTGSDEGYRALQRRLAVGKSVMQRARRCSAMAQRHEIQGYLHPRLELGKGRVCVATGLRCLRCFRTFHKRTQDPMHPEAVFDTSCGALTKFELRGHKRTLAHLQNQRGCIAPFCSADELPAMYSLYDQAIEHFAKGAVPLGGQRQKLSPCL